MAECPESMHMHGNAEIQTCLALLPNAWPPDPVECENAGCGALVRSLEINPYSFFRADWLRKVARSFVSMTEAGAPFTKRAVRNTPQEAVIFLNLRMRITQRTDLTPEPLSGIIIADAAIDDARPVAIVTLTMRPLNEALFSRQLRSRECSLAGGTRFGVLGEKQYLFSESDLSTLQDLYQNGTLVNWFGKSIAHRYYAALRFGAKTTLAGLVSECERAHVNACIAKEAVAAVAAAVAPPPNLADTAPLIANLGAELNRETGLVLDLSDIDESSSSSSSSSSSNDDSEQAAEVEEEAPTPAAMEEDVVITPEDLETTPPERVFLPITRTNELQWLRVAVHNKAYDLTFELTYIGSYGALRQRSKGVMIKRSALPTPLAEIYTPDEEQTVMLVTTEQRLSCNVATAQIAYKVPQDEYFVELDLPAPPHPVANVCYEQLTRPLQRLAFLNMDECTLCEFEAYAQFRIKALVTCKKTNVVETVYRNENFFVKGATALFGADFQSRKLLHPNIGLFVLCCASRNDGPLASNLMMLEKHWYRVTKELQGTELNEHIKDMQLFWREMPKFFQSEETDDDQEASSAHAFNIVLEHIVEEWRHLLKEAGISLL